MLERLGERSGRLPFSPGVRVGDKLFFGGMLPANADGLLPEARPHTGFPFHSDPLALQSEVLLSRLDEQLSSLGIGSQSVVRLEQWFAGPDTWPVGSEWSDISITRYIETRRKWFPSGVPASIAVGVRRLPVAGGLVGLNVLASSERDRETIMPPGEEDRAFPAGVRVGDWVYLSGELPTDWKSRDGSAVAAEARVDPTLWYGYPVRAQTEFLLRRLARIAEAAGSNLSRTVHATVFLADARDFVDFEEAWKNWFGEQAPARTTVPGVGLACRGCRVEIALELLSRRNVWEPEQIMLDLPTPPSREAHAVLAGNLLYVSGQMAVNGQGIDPRGLPDPAYPDLSSPAASQLELILQRLERICSAAGTGLDNLVQLRVFLPDLSRLGETSSVWRGVFGSYAPTGTALGVGPLLVPGGLLVVDAIAYVPNAKAQEQTRPAD